jgi:solute carrier family 25 carnitine/acylcarnitine transporter 20/29
LNTTSGLTLFLPTDPAWNALHPLEKLFLESEYATDDLIRILEMHAVIEKGVKWSDSFGTGINCAPVLHFIPLYSEILIFAIVTTVYGTNLEILVSPGKTTISSANLTHPDIYASNGVLHLVSSLLIPSGALRLTPEKYLLALNCTSFVSLLHSVDLTKFINDTDATYTILAPRDDVLRIHSDEGLPKKGTEALKRLLQYHFIPGIWTLNKLRHGMLLETALKEVGLDGGRQVLEIEVHEDKKKTKSVSFGGAGVIGDSGAFALSSWTITMSHFLISSHSQD